MKLGVFDSGLGGLVITRAIRTHLPHHDLIYMGDTLHMPYGGRSRDAIYHYTRQAMEYLFSAHDCKLIIIACNTASAAALRRLQQEYLPEHYPDRRILGVVVPTLEEAYEKRLKRIGLLATHQIVCSGVYQEELSKLDPDIRIVPQASPLLVPMIEHGGMRWIEPVLESYIQPLVDSGIEGLILGCTHYPYLKDTIRTMIGSDVALLSQDEIIPRKLADYLQRHPEIDSAISQTGKSRFLVTDVTDNYVCSAQDIFRDSLAIEKVEAA
ncbi:MAG: glutamate racemase [Rhodospirillales bacterium]|nr:glutamate racemase [Rhodospirillales bacterium]